MHTIHRHCIARLNSFIHCLLHFCSLKQVSSIGPTACTRSCAIRMVGGYNHTLSVQRGNGEPIARCCSFRSEPSKCGSSWIVHDGKIMNPKYDIYWNVDAVVKVSLSPNEDRASREVLAQVQKFTFTENVLGRCPAIAKRVKLVPTFFAEVDKIGKICKLQKRFQANKRGGILCKGLSVLIQHFVTEEVKDLFRLGENSQGSPTDGGSADSLVELVHESYKQTGGHCVIGGIKGVVERDARTGGLTYHVTSLTIHSRATNYGETDMATEGIELYERWIGLSRCRAAPSAPPLTTGENSHGHGLPQTGMPPPSGVTGLSRSTSHFVRTSQPNRVMSSEVPEEGQQDATQIAALFDRADCLGHVVSDLQACLNEMRGPPPSYATLADGA